MHIHDPLALIYTCIVGVLDRSVPQVLINREPLSHMTFDVELIGYSDAVVTELCRRLGQGWEMDGKGTPAGTSWKASVIMQFYMCILSTKTHSSQRRNIR